MIRFIDLRGQGTGYCFAFWDTVVDKFCEFDGEQAWENKAEFSQAFEASGIAYVDGERFMRLIPDWVDLSAP